ncbi:hypothetical protein Gpo141_00008063, partial [Globisporangium polare]
DAADTTEPVTDTPDTTEPDTTEPSTEAPTDAADTTEPVTDTPDTTEPDTTEPSTDAPATDAPATDAPETTEPDTTEPGTDAPTDAPATSDPATDAPTDVPATPDPSTTNAPTAADAPTNTLEEPAPFDPATPTPTIADTDPNTPFAFSRVVGLDLTRSSLKELSDSTASMYMKAGEKCAGTWYDSGCFMNTAMSKAMNGRFGSVTLDMSVTNETSALPSTHSLASFAGLGFLAAVLIAFAVKRTKTRRHGYAAIASEVEPINSGPI